MLILREIAVLNYGQISIRLHISSILFYFYIKRFMKNIQPPIHYKDGLDLKTSINSEEKFVRFKNVQNTKRE